LQPTGQISRDVHPKVDLELEAKVEQVVALEVDLQSDSDTPLISPQENISTPPKIPILQVILASCICTLIIKVFLRSLYQGASDDEDDFYETYHQSSFPILDTTALFPPTEYAHFSTRAQTRTA
jgi:hypothetical protein